METEGYNKSTQKQKQNSRIAKQTQAQQSTPFVKNNKIFAIIYLAFQIAIIVLYAIFIRPAAHVSIIDNGLFSAVGAAFLVLIGFGLYFSYLNKLRWSGLGFTFLITALVFQYYFLINAFWTKANVQVSNTNWAETHMPAYLSDQNANTSLGGIDTQGNTAVGAFKCALSLSIAFAAIGGRGGPLQAIIIVIFGTITYQLNRQILSLFSVNTGGSATIFEFGGLMGTAISIVLYFARHKPFLQDHHNYKSAEFNVTMALVGSVFIWVFFPVINMDIPNTLFIYSNAGISTIFCISSCVISTIAFTLIINGKIQYRDLITAPIVGGVVIGSSSTYVYNPAQAIIMGLVAGLLQILFNKIQCRLGRTPFWSNGVCFLFAIQGFLGSLFSSVIRAINRTGQFAQAYDNLIAKYVYNQRGQISATFITLGIGSLSGLVIGAILILVTKETGDSVYDDKTYWDIRDDGLIDKPEIAEPSSESQAVTTKQNYQQGLQPQQDHEYL